MFGFKRQTKRHYFFDLGDIPKVIQGPLQGGQLIGQLCCTKKNEQFVDKALYTKLFLLYCTFKEIFIAGKLINMVVGVGIYIKVQYKYTVLNYIKELSADKHFECVGVKVFLDKSNYIIVLSLYRSPDGDINVFLENINNVLNYITNRYLQKHFVICGDFNINFLKASKNLTELLDILNSYYITPTIKEPTRLTNCLDNICVNFENILFDSRVLNSAIVDHHAQVLSMILDTPSREKAVHYTRQINNKDNINYFCTLLAQESWEEVLVRDLDVNVKFNLLSEIMQKKTG